MPPVTVEDVLEHAARFEEMLSDYYADLARTSEREGVRLLTDYMSRHRKRIREFLDERSPAEKRRIKKIVLPFDPEAADCHCFEGMELPSDTTASEVLDRAVTLDECLIKLYRQAASEADDPEVRELFESLLKAEERDEVRLKKIKAMNYF